MDLINLFLVSLIFTLGKESFASTCDKPSDVTTPKSREPGRFLITIQGNPKSYIPFQQYNVTLRADPHAPQHFKRFSLTLDPLDANQQPGKFDFDKNYGIFARFSVNCPHTVTESSSISKREVNVVWTAPVSGSGCISILGTVIVSEELWFSETDGLNKTLCEETGINANKQPEKIKKCCACSEAKYEVAFEGRWIKNTHPKDYPSDVWATKFSDIIGASHQRNRAFWEEFGIPSPGLEELAKSGDTNLLQSELLDNGQFLRTIIKAKGLQHPYITQTSYAVFRVDKENHRVSLVAKIIPSPDWIVGVSDFELCTANGTWLDSYTYNLYPFDVGIDDGLSYFETMPIKSQFGPKRITAITENNPNNEKSPFFNEYGESMNPIAKLHFTRQRVYENECEDECTGAEDGDDGEEEKEEEEKEEEEA